VIYFSAISTKNTRLHPKKELLMENYHDARKILGLDLITPEEIMKTNGIVYNDTLLESFRKTLPNESILKKLSSEGYFLVAGPPSETSLYDIFLSEPNIFSLYNPKDDYYRREYERAIGNPVPYGGPRVYDPGYGQVEKVGSQWLALRKKIIPETIHKKYEHQLKYLNSHERVATAVETVWGMKIYKQLREVDLPEDKAWFVTSSIDRRGYYVVIGRIDGITIYFFEDKTGCWWGLQTVFQL
jgi:hypothetical protein